MPEQTQNGANKMAETANTIPAWTFKLKHYAMLQELRLTGGSHFESEPAGSRDRSCWIVGVKYDHSHVERVKCFVLIAMATEL